jgi:hypothetical protein
VIRETAAIGGMRVKTIDQHTIGTWVSSRVGVLVPHKGKERMCNSSLQRHQRNPTACQSKDIRKTRQVGHRHGRALTACTCTPRLLWPAERSRTVRRGSISSLRATKGRENEGRGEEGREGVRCMMNGRLIDDPATSCCCRAIHSA